MSKRGRPKPQPSVKQRLRSLGLKVNTRELVERRRGPSLGEKNVFGQRGNNIFPITRPSNYTRTGEPFLYQGKTVIPVRPLTKKRGGGSAESPKKIDPWLLERRREIRRRQSRASGTRGARPGKEPKKKPQNK